MQGAVWRANELGHAESTTISTGFPDLDAELPGQGWPCRSLTELLLPQAALCEWRLLAPALARAVADGGQVFLIAPPKTPHAPGLAQLGIPPDRLVWLQAKTPQERLWTTEQLVKANPQGAVLSWLPQARSEQIRRLQVHAQSCDAPVFLFRPVDAQRDASPAPLRVEVTLGRQWNLHVRIFKRKGTPHEGLLKLRAIPGRLADVLPPRLLRTPAAVPALPAITPISQEAADAGALGRTAPLTRSVERGTIQH
jgi:protein ImuA